MQVVVNPTSSRLQLLEPFNKWNGSDIIGAQVRPSPMSLLDVAFMSVQFVPS